MTAVDREAEQIVLGAMMWTAEVIAEVESIVTGRDFDDPAHTEIFAAITTAAAEGQPTSPVAVGYALGDRLARVGGAPYLHTLINAVPTAANAAHYAGIVAEQARLRRMHVGIARAGQYLQQAIASGTPSAEAAERIRAFVESLDDPTASTGPVVWRDILTPALDAIEQAADQEAGPRGLSTGLPDLDEVINGLQAGQLVTIAGRPSMGKSVLGVDFCRHAAMELKVPAALFSLEMRRDEVFNRIIAARTRIDLSRIINGAQLDDHDWARIARACGDTEDAPLYIDDTPGLSVADIRARARMLHRRHGIGLIAVDYLQLVEAPRGIDNRQQQVTAMSRALKLLGQELEVPVVMCAQLNRGPEQRHDKRPQMSDLRESGSLEQDSDIVILIHREDYYDPKSPRSGEADLIVAKNRNGPRKTVVVAAPLQNARFVSIALGAS